MPDRQGDQVQWARTFTAVVGPAAAEYGVPADLMTRFGQATAVLASAWDAAAETNTRTRVTVEAKDEALAAMKRLARECVSHVQGTASVTNAMKVAAGVTVRDARPSPSPVPTDQPFVKVVSVDGRTVTVELRQHADRRGRPAKVAGATVFASPTGVVGGAADDWRFVANTTRTRLEIPFPPSATGDTVYVTAYWNNSRDQAGPAARPVAVNLPAGGTVPGEAGEAPRMKIAA